MESYTTIHTLKRSEFSAGTLNAGFFRGYDYDLVGRVRNAMTGTTGATRWAHAYDSLGRLTERVTGGDCSITGEDANTGVLTACNRR